MADVDEDVIPRDGPETTDIDLSDETQDFRFLSVVSKEDSKIPKRGEKDFEPHSTALQSNTLAASRQAMHDALSFQRVHPPKRHELAVYDPESNMAYLDGPRSTLFKSMGKISSSKTHPNRLWLLPEEILYLVERGTVDCRWPTTDSETASDGLPMSLQGAYAAFIGLADSHDDGLTHERYTVYAGLKRMGYAVHRAPSWNSTPPPPTKECFPPVLGTWQSLGLAAHRWRESLFNRPAGVSKNGPLLGNKTYRSYADIYRSLALVPWYDPAAQTPSDIPADQGLRVTYHVWKPNNARYKKSDPGEPDFRIAVLDARQSKIPTMKELSGLLAGCPYRPPAEGGQLYAKLRNGYKNVILAVVDEGVTSYLRVADGGFGREKLYGRTGPPSKGKRGGGGNKPQAKK
ncbi:hypothetical protein MBLNU457_1156t1 [Dothideomycetes sp. NU457]